MAHRVRCALRARCEGRTAVRTAAQRHRTRRPQAATAPVAQRRPHHARSALWYADDLAASAQSAKDIVGDGAGEAGHFGDWDGFPGLGAE
jgi:hypothetical protein